MKHNEDNNLIETERLLIKPLTLRQLEKYVRLDNSL